MYLPAKTNTHIEITKTIVEKLALIQSHWKDKQKLTDELIKKGTSSSKETPRAKHTVVNIPVARLANIIHIANR